MTLKVMDETLGIGATPEAQEQETMIDKGTPVISRRELLSGVAAGATVALLVPGARPAWASPRSVTLTFAVAADPREAASG